MAQGGYMSGWVTRQGQRTHHLLSRMYAYSYARDNLYNLLLAKLSFLTQE
jgi:hypothetical protein